MKRFLPTVRGATQSRASLMLLVASVLIASGCASKEIVMENRRFPTGIAPGDAVAFLMIRYLDLGNEEGKVDAEVRATFEQSLFSCVSRELHAPRLGLRVVSPRELRDAAFPGQAADQLPESPEALIELLGDGRTIRNPTTYRVRYVVLLDARSGEPGRKRGRDLGRDGYAVGKEWTEYVRLDSTVLDIAQRRIAGSLFLSTSKVSQATNDGLFMVLPFPIIIQTDPLANACTKLGQALTSFLSN
jgi:hypothetical protein